MLWRRFEYLSTEELGELQRGFALVEGFNRVPKLDAPTHHYAINHKNKIIGICHFTDLGSVYEVGCNFWGKPNPIHILAIAKSIDNVRYQGKPLVARVMNENQKMQKVLTRLGWQVIERGDTLTIFALEA